MAGCGELDQTLNALTSSKQTENVAGDPLPSTSPLECAICLQTCVHPVRLPCHHVFCFLCVKGASWHSKRCALCRQDVPEGFLASPTLLSPGDLKAAAAGGVSRGSGGGGAGDDGSRDDCVWYYEGHNGWWQYDERTGRELEEAFAKGRSSAEMLIAGFVYVADMERMVQYRRNARGRRRRMKRDAVGIPKKGVAGLRLDPEPAPLLPPVPAGCASSVDGAQTTGRSLVPGLGDVVSAAPPVRPPTLLGAPLDCPQSPPPSASLEQALSQLLISQEGAEEGRALSGGQSDELSSGEGEEGGRSDGRVPGEELGELPAGRMAPRGGPSSSMRGARPHCPDGQCMVTQV